jgi:hypothetical protein
MCYCVVLDESFSCAFGSPPEWIKRAGGFPFPSYIFLGDTVFSEGRNFCEVEFPIYKNFFFNKQRKTHIIAPRRINEILRPVLEEALFGPAAYEENDCSSKAAFYADYLAVREGFSQTGRKLLLPDFAGFETYDGDVYRLGFVTIIRTGENAFLIRRGKEEIAIELKAEKSVALKEATHKAKGELVLHCFDSGDGFSVSKECSSFMLQTGEKYLIFDPNYRSLDFFLQEDHSLHAIAGIVISHIHADHDQGLFRFLHASPSISIYSAGEVAHSIEKKLRLLYGAAEHAFSIKKLSFEKPTFIDEIDAEVQCEYGFHSIPSVMMKFRFFDIAGKECVFGYSGDTLYDPVRFQEERFPASYRDALVHFFDDANVIVHEAGAGLIHTDPEDLIPFLRDDQKVYWLHTARTNDDGFSRGMILEKGRDIILA